MSTSLKGRKAELGKASYNDITSTTTGINTGLDVNVVGGSVTTTPDPAVAAASANTATNTANTVIELQTLVADMVTLLANQVAQTTELQTIVTNQVTQTTELQNQVTAQNATTAALVALATASAGDATAANQALALIELQTAVTDIAAILVELDHKSTQLVHEEHDDIERITVNANGDPLTVEYRLATVVVATVENTYDATGNWVRSRRI